MNKEGFTEGTEEGIRTLRALAADRNVAEDEAAAGGGEAADGPPKKRAKIGAGSAHMAAKSTKKGNVKK